MHSMESSGTRLVVGLMAATLACAPVSDLLSQGPPGAAAPTAVAERNGQDVEDPEQTQQTGATAIPDIWSPPAGWKLVLNEIRFLAGEDLPQFVELKNAGAEASPVLSVELHNEAADAQPLQLEIPPLATGELLLIWLAEPSPSSPDGMRLSEPDFLSPEAGSLRR